MDLANFTGFQSRFRDLPGDSTFQITYVTDNPRTHAQVSDDVLEELRTGTEEVANIYRLASRAAHLAREAQKLRQTQARRTKKPRTARRPQKNVQPQPADPATIERLILSAEALGVEAATLIRDPATGKEYETMIAKVRYALHHAAMVLEGVREVGPIFTASVRFLPRRFCTVAAAAARAADLVAETASEDVAFRAWCQALQRRGYFGPLDTLMSPIEASVELVRELIQEAIFRSGPQTVPLSPRMPPNGATDRPAAVQPEHRDRLEAIPPAPESIETLDSSEGRKKALNAFLRRCEQEADLERPLFHADFWAVAMNGDRRAGERWLQGLPNQSAEKKCRQTLQRSTPSFLAALAKAVENRRRPAFSS